MASTENVYSYRKRRKLVEVFSSVHKQPSNKNDVL